MCLEEFRPPSSAIARCSTLGTWSWSWIRLIRIADKMKQQLLGMTMDQVRQICTQLFFFFSRYQSLIVHKDSATERKDSRGHITESCENPQTILRQELQLIYGYHEIHEKETWNIFSCTWNYRALNLCGSTF